jgi:predicted permease
MSTVALAILPVVAAIALGYLLKVRGVPQNVWAIAEKSVFYLFLPALIVHHVAIRDIAFDEVLKMVVPIAGTLLIVGALAYWSSRLLLRDPPGTAASVHQASIRLNGVVMIAIMPAMLGDAVWPYVAVMTSVWPAWSSTQAVLVYVRASGASASLKGSAFAVIKNPVIIAVALGAGLNVAGFGPWIEAFGLFDLIGRAALPVGLLAAGAALEFRALKRSGPPSLLATVIKLAVMPPLVYVLCQAAGLPLLVTQLMVISAALPSSPSGYVLASQMGGDSQTMASAITLQHVLGMVSVALVAGWMLAG